MYIGQGNLAQRTNVSFYVVGGGDSIYRVT